MRSGLNKLVLEAAAPFPPPIPALTRLLPCIRPQPCPMGSSHTFTPELGPCGHLGTLDPWLVSCRTKTVGILEWEGTALGHTGEEKGESIHKCIHLVFCLLSPPGKFLMPPVTWPWRQVAQPAKCSMSWWPLLSPPLPITMLSYGN